ncbi:MAG: nucleotide sugar dehydrogenase, partial [Gammaproteobacteria bacterium]
MKVFVHGCGLTAMVTAGALAASGHHVCLRRVEAGGSLVPVDEPGLDALIRQQVDAGRLLLDEPQGQPEGQAVHFLAFAPDQHALAEACVDAVAGTSADLLVVNRTNFGVGATGTLGDRLRTAREGRGRRTAAACLPDFLRRGTALANFNRPDRIILGTDEAWAETLLREILRPFVGYESQVIVMPSRDAEFTKQVVNGMLATRLSYMNDMANVADAIGVDIEHVRRGVGSDERIGGHFLQPGCGFGGTGFYQDLLSLKSTLDSSGVASKLLDTALTVNDEQKDLLFRKLWKHFRGRLAGRRIAVWGVAFKPDTDRVDYAPSLRIVESLLAQGAEVVAHDPRALA